MKRYYILIILSALLVLASAWTQASDVDSLSLFQSNLKEEVLNSKRQGFGLQEDVSLKQWIDELNLQGNLITANNKEDSAIDNEPKEEKKLVKGISFYNSQKEINDKVDFFSKEEIIVRKRTGLQLAILPGVLVDGSYEIKKDRMDSEFNYDFSLKQQLGFDIDYRLNQRLNVNAGYYLTGEKESDSRSISGIDDWQMDFDSSEVLTENIKKIGIDYDTSERTSIFANYLEEDSEENNESTTTVVGVKYNDNEDRIAFQYQVEDSKEKKSNSTGVEVGINDFARLKAIYTMIDEDTASDDKLIDGESSFESKLLDLGLDLYVNDDTSVKLGYQLSDKNKENGSEQIWDRLKPEEANIELELKF